MKLKTWFRFTKAVWTDFKSSFISGIAWEDGVLFVRMGDRGAIWAYEGVPEELFHEFMDAGSKGTFYNNEIKGVYDGDKVGEDGTPVPVEEGDDLDWPELDAKTLNVGDRAAVISVDNDELGNVYAKVIGVGDVTYVNERTEVLFERGGGMFPNSMIYPERDAVACEKAQRSKLPHVRGGMHLCPRCGRRYFTALSSAECHGQGGHALRVRV